ncbi:putative pentatricopeptide repeat-containing protein, mitochondrial, partial [Cucurbita argyrosperma subsp. argyrosperma]
MAINKLTCALLFAAATVTAVVASTEAPALAPGPSSDAAAAAVPAVGAFIGASVASFLSNLNMLPRSFCWYFHVKDLLLSPIYTFSRQISLSPSPNLKTLCSNGQLNEALLQMAILGSEMKFEGYDTILNQCVSRRAIREGQRVHAHMIKTCYLPPVYLRTRLIVLYNKCDCLGDAREVFDEMPLRNVVSWTAMISAYSQRGFASQALNLFVAMLRSGCLGFEIGRQIHSIVIKRNYESHMFVGSSLLDMYAKSGRVHEAHGVFQSLPERDVVVCTAIISGYAQMGLDVEALKLFRQLQSEGMHSNYVTYASVLTALSGLAALNHGKQVHNHVLRSGQSLNVVLLNSLIDMYSKCGNVCYARRIFDHMSERTCISWNAMLVGYSKHGMGGEVLELFKLMREENKVKPDSITYLAVLSGCSHGQLEHKGLEIFYNMADGKDGIEPDIEHYGCVVDLLGRVGRIEEAFDFIRKMPYVPTAAIWGSLLGSCRVHSNVDIGIIVGQKLLEIEPENAGNYVILSNLYASAGKWEDMRNIRDLMQEKAVIKEPGRSWVELDQIEEGYVPNLSCVLYDVDEEQKEKVLLGHSEKLAMAFWLIAAPEGATIRVIKNLRVCVDCHSFAKFVSKLYART